MTAELVKQLRQITGAGLLDCKKAIEECNADLEAAKDWIRAKGLATASKVASRTAAEGVIGVKVVGNNAIIIELNSETDFVAKNEQFQQLVTQILNNGLHSNNIEELNNITLPDGKTVEQEIQNNIATIREKLSLRRMHTIHGNENTAIGYYIHNKVADNMGRIAVLVELEADKPIADLQTLANNIAMHIAAAKPLTKTIDELDKAHIERERAIAQEKAASSGRPEPVLAKMVDGMINKFYEEVVLLEQFFVLDQKQKIHQVLSNASKEKGANIRIKQFIKYEVGEGITQQAKNFADEVASITKNQ